MAQNQSAKPAQITCACPLCGQLTLPITELTLYLDDSIDADINTATYGFKCPTCSDSVIRPASYRIITGLALRSVRIERPSAATHFSTDTVEDFVRQLAAMPTADEPQR